PFVKVAGHAAAQVFRFTDINHFPLGVLVQIHAGLGRNGAEFSLQIHGARHLFYWMEKPNIMLQQGLMSSMSVFSTSPRSLHAAIMFVTVVFTTAVVSAQSITPAPRSQSTQPQMTKSPAGKEEEAARAPAPPTAPHFDRVLIIVLENVDYEVASQDKSLAELAAGGASLTNFHAMFHPSYPNYLAMVAGTDFGIHRRGRLLADNQVNYPADAAHQTIADRLISSGLDFKQ